MLIINYLVQSIWRREAEETLSIPTLLTCVDEKASSSSENGPAQSLLSGAVPDRLNKFRIDIKFISISNQILSILG